MFYTIACYDPTRLFQILGLTPQMPEAGKPMITFLCENPIHSSEMYHRVYPLTTRLKIPMTLDQHMIHMALERSESIMVLMHYLHTFAYIQSQEVKYIEGMVYSTIVWSHIPIQ
jgi:hypothetical protein